MSTPDRTSNMTGNMKRKMRSAARLYAVQALFQMEASGQTIEAVCDEFETHRFGAVYEGDFAAGKPEGKGKITHADGMNVPMGTLCGDNLQLKIKRLSMFDSSLYSFCNNSF